MLLITYSICGLLELSLLAAVESFVESLCHVMRQNSFNSVFADVVLSHDGRFVCERVGCEGVCFQEDQGDSTVVHLFM